MNVSIGNLALDVSMKQPRSDARLELPSVGYGLQQAWVYAVFFGNCAQDFNFSCATFSIFGSIPLQFFVSLLVFGIFLVGFGISNQRLRYTISKRWLSIVAAVVFSLGTFILLIPASSYPLACIVPIVSGVLTGFGSAVFLIIWGVKFARMDNSSIVLNSVVSFVIAFLLYALLLQNLNSVVSTIVCGFIPFAELIIWQIIFAYDQPYLDVITEHKYVTLKNAHVMVRFGIPIALFGFALGFIRTAATTYIANQTPLGTSVTIFLTVCLAALLTMFLYIALAETSRWNSVFKLLVPCVAIAIFCIPLMEKEAYSMSALCVITGFILFECMMWIYFGFIAQKFNLAPILVYGVGRGVLAIFSLLGTMFCELDTMALLGLQPTVKMSAVLVILTIAYIALPDREAIGLMRKRVFAMHDSFDDVDLDFDDISELPRNVKICSNCINSNVSDCTNIQNNNGENNPSSPSDVSHANYTANTTATAHDNATHTATHDTAHNQGANLMTQSTTPQTTNTEPAAIDRIPQQVEVIANTYLLSRREIDVLACLARGHNASYICKHLYIAEGTAKTHIRHIYRKLNVHSQHELMELVEQIEI